MKDQEITGYQLSRQWFDFCFENPEKIKPNHTALYFFTIEHCNRLGWKKKFGLPSTMVMEAIGIKSYNTYIKTLNDLIEWGFVVMVEKSRNQYSSNIVALSNNDKANNKALDKALTKHATKQRESTGESIDSIDKQETSNQRTINKQPLSDEIELLFEDEETFIQVFDLWCDYRRESKKTIKGKKALQGQINKVHRLSGGDLEKARAVIMQSIENNWQGLFELKDQKNDNPDFGTPERQSANRDTVTRLAAKYEERQAGS